MSQSCMCTQRLRGVTHALIRARLHDAMQMTDRSLPSASLFPLVYIEAVGPDPKGVKAESQIFSQSVDGELRTSASGVCWAVEGDTAFVLGPASLVKPFTRNKNHKKVLTEADILPTTRFTAIHQGESRPLKLLGVVEVPGLADHVQSICSGEETWRWGWKLSEASKPTAYDVYARLAIFACKAEASTMPKRAAEIRQARLLQQGAALQCCGSPFGCLAPHHFQEYLATGCVASSPPEGSSACLADIHCLPGMEGAPVLDSEGHFYGILAAPLSSAKYDAEVCVIISAAAITQAFRAWRNEDSALPSSPTVPPAYHELRTQKSSGPQASPSGQQLGPHPTSMPAAVESLDTAWKSVVAVACGGSWASGVVVDRHGLVITVAHALEPDTLRDNGAAQEQGGRVATPMVARQGIRVGVPSRGGELTWYPASLAYRFSRALDLAVLRADVPPDALRPVTLCHRPTKIGQAVFLVGYGLFYPDRLGTPLVGKGVVSNVIRSMHGAKDSGDVMLITSAAVHPGCSGGALLDGHGCLLGLVTSNTRHAASGRSFPRLNFSIAAAALEPTWHLLRSNPSLGPSAFAALDEESEELRALWMLREPPNVLGGRQRSEEPLQRLSRLLEMSGVQLEQEPSKL